MIDFFVVPTGLFQWLGFAPVLVFAVWLHGATLFHVAEGRSQYIFLHPINLLLLIVATLLLAVWLGIVDVVYNEELVLGLSMAPPYEVGIAVVSFLVSLLVVLARSEPNTR